jgi:hypothetical protein
MPTPLFSYRRLFFVLLMLVSCGSLWLVVSAYGDSESDENAMQRSYQRYFNSHYKIFSLSLPNDLTFAEELVPLDKIDVSERLDRELLVNTYWQSQTLLFHKRAHRWFPIIEAILAEEGVPDDFKYLALIESGLTNVVSPAGATGYWQIRKATGIELNLEVNDIVDERYNVEKSTRAACKYLKQAHAKFGNWTMAAASYNLGMHGLKKQMNRQKIDNYYDLLLVEETSRYLFRILAAKEIISKPAQYGFHFRPSDLYATYNVREVEVDSGIDDLVDFALKHGANYKVLKILNPWLRENYLPASPGKIYAIQLPADDAFGMSVLVFSDEDKADSLDFSKID